jgi:hypothetical protein
MSFRFLARYLGSLLIGIAIVGIVLVTCFSIFFPLVASAPWPVQLLFIETIVIPLSAFTIYLLYRVVLIPFTEQKSNYTLRQWVAVFVLIYIYGIGLVFFSFLLEEFTPFLPLFYRGVLLPMIINLILIVVVTRTRIWLYFDRFIKKLFGEPSGR